MTRLKGLKSLKSKSIHSAFGSFGYFKFKVGVGGSGWWDWALPRLGFLVHHVREWKAHLQRIQGTPIAPTRARRVHMCSSSKWKSGHWTFLSSGVSNPVQSVAPQYGRKSGGVTERIRGLPVLAAALVTCFSQQISQLQASRSCFMNYSSHSLSNDQVSNQQAVWFQGRMSFTLLVTDVPHHVSNLMKLQEVQPVTAPWQRHGHLPIELSSSQFCDEDSKFESIRDPSFHPDVLLLIVPCTHAEANSIIVGIKSGDSRSSWRPLWWESAPNFWMFPGSLTEPVGDHVLPVLRHFRLVPEFWKSHDGIGHTLWKRHGKTATLSADSQWVVKINDDIDLPHKRQQPTSTATVAPASRRRRRSTGHRWRWHWSAMICQSWHFRHSLVGPFRRFRSVCFLKTPKLPAMDQTWSNYVKFIFERTGLQFSSTLP